MTRALLHGHRHILLAIATLALATRILVPAGWMPSHDLGRTTITLCTGQGMVEAWIDADGTIHKGAPDKGGKTAGDCVFSTLALTSSGSPQATNPLIPLPAGQLAFLPASAVAIGHGLAAPPPPARGPPHLI